MDIRFTFFILVTALTISANANALEGKTADGCTYKVINGQYLTQCPSSPASPPSEPTTYVAPQQNDKVVSYDAVPVRSNPSAPVPSVQTARAPVMDVAIETPSQSDQINESKEVVKSKAASEILDTTYAGLSLGSSSLKNSTSAMGFMANVGTFIDQNFGFELGYSYSGQGLKIGLDSRGNSGANGGFGGTSAKADDVSLKTHLITGEMQGHFTETFRRMRPYLGLGLGYRMASLKERSSPDYMTGGSNGGGSLSQNTFGGIASAGAKLKIDRSLFFTFSFRYFFPLASQKPQIDSGNGFASTTRLKPEDSLYTEGSQTQLLGGLLLNF